jgi:hypothetical protein
MSKRADSGPLRRRKPPARPYKRDARKRGSATYHLRPLPHKCKSFALSAVRTVRHPSPRAEELIERSDANTQLGPKLPGHHTYALLFLRHDDATSGQSDLTLKHDTFLNVSDKERTHAQ